MWRQCGVILLVLLSLSACSVQDRKDTSCPPEWFQPDTRLASGFYYAQGSGKSLVAARTEAQAELSRQLNIRLNSMCTDTQRVTAAGSEDRSECVTEMRSHARFAALPLARHEVCDGQHYVALHWDARPLSQQLGLSEDGSRLSYLLFSNRRQTPSIRAHFDTDTRLWSVHGERNVLAEQASLWQAMNWQGCQSDLSFGLVQGGLPVHRLAEGDRARIHWSSPNTAGYFTLLNVLDSGAVQVLGGKSYAPAELQALALDLQAHLLPGQWLSDEAYLLLHSEQPLYTRFGNTTHHPAQQLAMLLDLLASGELTAHCAVPLRVEVAN